jgi:hypothetical protein
VEVGSNTSIVTLRVVGGDEKGSLESETVKILSRIPWESDSKMIALARGLLFDEGGVGFLYVGVTFVAP